MKFVTTAWDTKASEFLHKSEHPTLGRAVDRLRTMMYNSEYLTDLTNGEVSLQLTVHNREESGI